MELFAGARVAAEDGLDAGDVVEGEEALPGVGLDVVVAEVGGVEDAVDGAEDAAFVFAAQEADVGVVQVAPAFGAVAKGQGVVVVAKGGGDAGEGEVVDVVLQGRAHRRPPRRRHEAQGVVDGGV